MQNLKEIDKQAIYWYVRIRSTEFTSAQEADFMAWLESSSLHQAAFIRAEQAWVAGKAIGQLPVNNARTVQQKAYWAGAFAILLAGFLLFLFTSRNLFSTNTLAEHYITQREQQRTLTLSDGSSVTMHTDSEIRVSYDAGHRQVTLQRGRIFLQVAPDHLRPFYVITQNGTLRVVGTQFAVTQLRDDFRVTVVEGVVGILQPGDTLATQSSPLLLLRENQQILYSNAIAREPALEVDAARETSWIKGRMMFDGAPLAEVVAILNQYLSRPILIASPELETKRIVGAISVKDPKAAAASLASITEALVEEAEGQDALIIKPARAGFPR
jgi:transmembrane sensor